MTVAEAMLNGESVPVHKLANDGTQQGMGVPGGDDLPFVFSGTLVVQGKEMAEVAGRLRTLHEADAGSRVGS